MGIDIGPIEVVDGLVFYIDAANTRSYSGNGNTIWSDLSSSNANGKLYSGAGFTSEFGGGISFDGTDDYFITDSATSFNALTQMTAEITFKLIASISGYKHIFNKPLNTNGGTWALYCGNFTNKLTWYLNADSNTFSFSDVTIGTVYSYVMTYDQNNIKTYVNGNLISSVSYTTSLSYDNSKPINIGRFDTTNFLGPNVSIYNAKLYNRALLATEIFQNYNATKGRYR